MKVLSIMMIIIIQILRSFLEELPHAISKLKMTNREVDIKIFQKSYNWNSKKLGESYWWHFQLQQRNESQYF